MQNAVINMCEKFHYDWLRNDRALGNGKSDNNKNPNSNNKKNVCGHWGPVSLSSNIIVIVIVISINVLYVC